MNGKFAPALRVFGLILVVGLSALAARLIRLRTVVPPKVVASVAPVSSQGKLVYQVQCARCHGAEGHGDGPDAVNLNPPPRDFAANHWRFSPSPESIRKVVVEGIAGTSMSAQGGSLSPRELDAVVAHVRTLGPKSSPTPALEAHLKAAGFEPQMGSKQAPSIEVEDLGGVRRVLVSGPGKLTLLVFWGTSCAPCLSEMPDLERLAVEFQAQGLDVFPVCVDEADRGVVGRLVRGRFDRFPVFVNPDGMARLRYDIQTLPVAALVDRGGNLLGVARGGTEWQGPEARRLIAGCLASGAD